MKVKYKYYIFVIAVTALTISFLLGKTVSSPNVDMEKIHKAYTGTQSINLKMQEWRNSSNKLGLVRFILSDPSMNYLDFSIEEVKLKIVEMEQRITEINDDGQKRMIEEEIERAEHTLKLAEQFKSTNN